MNQVYSGNYQSYQPSYQTPCCGQWTGYGYRGSGYNDYYGSSKVSTAPCESYGRKTYSTPCMGQCNPPKLYADTYNYLTENLVKPVIEEVYQDLKSITAANTIANNSAAAKIGLQTAGQPALGQGTQQNAQGQSQVLTGAVPLSAGHIQGQLHNVSAVRPVTPTQIPTMPQNKPLRSQPGALEVMQKNASISRNGLIQV